MDKVSSWQLLKGPKGFTIMRPRSHMLQETFAVQIPTNQVPRWRLKLTKILGRHQSSIRHTLPMSLGLRMVTGCWNGKAKRVGYLGSLPGQNHLIMVGPQLYFLVNLGDMAAYPISLGDLKHILACLH
jgi:hypothetical protein